MLPEKWCIKLTKENINIVGDFYNKLCTKDTECYTNDSSIGGYLSSHCRGGRYKSILGPGDHEDGSHYANFFCLNSYAEQITTEEFIKYVLNKEIELNYEIY